VERGDRRLSHEGDRSRLRQTNGSAGSYIGLIHITISAMLWWLTSPYTATPMPFETSNSAVVHVVDDDAALRGALESLFDSVGLDTRPTEPLATFLTRALRISPDASLSTSACPI